MKISEVTVDDLANYMRLDDPSDIELEEIERMLNGRIAFIKGYTGLTDKEIDEHEDLTDALFVLVADKFDNRSYQTERVGGVNKMVKTILEMYSVNLL